MNSRWLSEGWGFTPEYSITHTQRSRCTVYTNKVTPEGRDLGDVSNSTEWSVTQDFWVLSDEQLWGSCGQSICFAESSHHIYVLPKDPNGKNKRLTLGTSAPDCVQKTAKHIGWLSWKAESFLGKKEGLGHRVTPGHCMQPSAIHRAWSSPKCFADETARGNVALADRHLRSATSTGSNGEEHMASRKMPWWHPYNPWRPQPESAL